MQVTYFNDSKDLVAIFAGPGKEGNNYIGYVAPKTMTSFDLKIPDGHGIFIKLTDKNILLVGTTELQTSPKDEEEIVMDEITPTYYEEHYGNEP